MSQKEHEAAGAMAKEVDDDDDDDDKRLYECSRKYEIIVKQFDELLGLIDGGTSLSKSPKRRKGRKGSTSGVKAAISSNNQPSNEAIVQTVTRFLHELSATPSDAECSRSKRG